MTKNNIQNNCIPRFKGVENFLRRVAFNLGNSPSQTEVKIISCIPIDVTDLQEKIIDLEKQLCEARAQTACSSDVTPPAVHAAIGHARYPRRSAPPPHTCAPPRPEPQDASAATLPCPEPPSPSNQQCSCYFSDTASNTDEPKSRGGIFKKAKKKKSKKKDKLKSHFVYYAQTTTTGPFADYLDAPTPDRSAESPSRAYITDVIRKQYAPVPIAQDALSTSQFSSPVCRDLEQTAPAARTHESDVCSCCHGTFHNIDQHMATHNYTDVLNTFPTCSYRECMNNTSFYDSSLYDMVPVRDKPARTMSPYYETPKIKVPKSVGNATYCPQRIRSKTRFQPMIINHYAAVPSNYTTKKVRRVSPMRKENKVDRLKHTETSNSCCIDCGNVYMKRTCGNNKKNKPVQPQVKPYKSATYKNAECLTNILNDTECQTTTTRSVQIDQELLEEKKTEETLNQIKSILQSVLTEVKTNTQQKKTPETKEKVTRDAVVQKGVSQGNMPGYSSLLHSFTYSPYDMNPYMASCSRQMNSGPCCFQNLPYPSAKCMQNFPVFIQTPGRHVYASCYRHSSHVPKVPQPKPAATTATNTESQERSKETEKLIKEIYKSMANNMEFPTKDTSASEYNDLKSTPRVSVNKSLYRPSVLNEGRKFMKANASKNLQMSTTPITTMNSKLMSNTLSMRSHIVSTTDTERNIRNSRIDSYLENLDAHRKRQNKIEEEIDYDEPTPETTASDEETSDSDASVREAYVHHAEEPVKVQKPNKKGLFNKMLKSVKLFQGKSKNKKKEEPVEEENEEESDGNSDDYQTIYSQRIERRPRYVPRAVRSPYRLRAHSKISYSRHMRDRNPERAKRPPYMEQEYRRHWNERLIFNENRQRHSSDSPYSKETPRRDPYWRNYEARSAMVNNNQVLNSRYPNPSERPKMTREDILRAVDEGPPKENAATKGLAWLKKHNMGIRCGPAWKKLILEG